MRTICLSAVYLLHEVLWPRAKMSVDDILGGSFMAEDDDEVRLLHWTIH